MPLAALAWRQGKRRPHHIVGVQGIRFVQFGRRVGKLFLQVGDTLLRGLQLLLSGLQFLLRGLQSALRAREQIDHSARVNQAFGNILFEFRDIFHKDRVSNWGPTSCANLQKIWDLVP